MLHHLSMAGPKTDCGGALLIKNESCEFESFILNNCSDISIIYSSPTLDTTNKQTTENSILIM